MKLYRAKIEPIARELIDRFMTDGDIEVSDRSEAEMDIHSVLKEYLRLEQQVIEETKDTLEARKLPYGQFGKVKRLIADQKGLGLGEESVGWMCSQILETFMESSFVEEIFSTDSEMRRKMRDILKKHMMLDEDLDAEVRQRIRNMQEGTNAWEIEYGKALEQIKRRRGLDK